MLWGGRWEEAQRAKQAGRKARKQKVRAAMVGEIHRAAVADTNDTHVKRRRHAWQTAVDIGATGGNGAGESAIGSVTGGTRKKRETRKKSNKSKKMKKESKTKTTHISPKPRVQKHVSFSPAEAIKMIPSRT